MNPIFLILASMLVVVALHPFVTYPLSLMALAYLRPRPLAAQPECDLSNRSVALCICAYNEAPVIARTIKTMLSLRGVVQRLEILVYVDAATDETTEILRGFGDSIRLIVSPTRYGKTHGMNQLVSITSAEFLVFTDANVIFTPDTIPCLLRPFADPKVGCVSGRLTYIEPTRTASASMVSRYWRLDQKIKELESRTGSAIGAAGAIFAVRYHLHCSPPPDIIEDMYVSISILCDGHRVVFVEDAIGYEEMVSRPREEFGRKIRISCQAFNVHRLLRPRLRTLSALNRYKYVSHKLLRWITIYLLGMSALSIVAGLVLAGSWLLLAGLTMTSLLTFVAGRLQPRSAAAKLLAATDALVATGIGVCRSVRGERFQTWSPPASGRGPARASE